MCRRGREVELLMWVCIKDRPRKKPVSCKLAEISMKGDLLPFFSDLRVS